MITPPVAIVRAPPVIFNVFVKRENEWTSTTAPVIVALCCDLSKSWQRKDGKNFGDIDVAIAMDHITIAAAEAGLGTCWIGNFDIAEARRVLELPKHIEPVVFTPLGYPAIEPVPKKRKPLDEIVCWEKFGGKYGD